MDILDILKKAAENQAADIFIVCGAVLSFKANGRMYELDGNALSPEDTRIWCFRYSTLQRGISPRSSFQSVRRIFRFQLPGWVDSALTSTSREGRFRLC